MSALWQLFFALLYICWKIKKYFFFLASKLSTPSINYLFDFTAVAGQVLQENEPLLIVNKCRISLIGQRGWIGWCIDVLCQIAQDIIGLKLGRLHGSWPGSGFYKRVDTLSAPSSLARTCDLARQTQTFDRIDSVRFKWDQAHLPRNKFKSEVLSLALANRANGTFF